MLYVFQVDIGTMMTFEMRLAMETVGNLKKAIAQKTEIPEDKQVLLISGGESLNNSQRVCSYSSAGTDTSPIFLFAKINIESDRPLALNVDYSDDTDMMEMIESCMSMQPSLDTLVARTELAADLNEQASRQRDMCERFVHDQHLQQQGWAAVTANLEDLTRAFRNKSEMLLMAFGEFTKCKKHHKDLLQHFQDDIQRLDDIPILPTLLEGNKLFTQILDTRSTSSSTANIDRLKAHASRHDSGIRSAKAGQAEVDEETGVLGAARKGLNDSTSGTEEVAAATVGVDSDFTAAQDKDETSATHSTDEGESTTNTNDEETKHSEDEFLDAHQGSDKADTTSESVSEQQQQQQQDSPQPATTQQTGADQLQPGPSNTSSDDQNAAITLRQWIDYHDNHNSLERLVELCWRGLERFTDSNAQQIRHDVQELLKSANNNNMKEIKGLEERLFGLEKLMVDAKKVVDEQSQLAASFQMNRERFSKIKDSTLLPDLSASHKQQLQMMLTNHKKMNDYRNRCVRAKHELSVNLHARLKWIMYIEQQISDLDGKLMIYKENLLRLNRHFEIVEQIHKAPDLYLASVVESLRRRRFSRRYLHWANSIAKISQDLYHNEMATRKAFDDNLGAHFLSNLFPGLTRSYPPPFATKQPDPFDTKLPRITAADIQYLQANLSEELAKTLYIPKDVPLPHIISSPNNLDYESVQADGPGEGLDDDRRSSNPTPPSSPTR